MPTSAINISVFTKLWNEPLPALARRLHEWGVDGLELPVRPGYPVEPARLETDLPAAARLFADAGLRIFSIAPPVDMQVDGRWVAACGAAGVPLIRTMIPVDARGYLACEAAAQNAIAAQVPALISHGVRVGVQNHYGRFVANAAGLRRVVEHFDSRAVTAVYDVGHCGLDGEIPELAIDLLWSHLGMVNLKNMVWERTNGPDSIAATWRKRVVAGREGLASWPDAIAQLLARGFEGVMTISAEFDEVARKEELLAADLAFARELLANVPTPAA
jgi:sugar phosphate isomerase/epimerase